jgi:5-methyltetrahydropteroyltriglutamate--homocysteine methyltransferase
VSIESPDTSRTAEAFPRAENVGSLLRDDAVVRAARRSSPADNALLGDAVRDAIRLQEEVGLDVITDGETRRTSWAQTLRFVDAFALTTGQEGLNWRGATEGRWGAPDPGGRVVGEPTVVRPVSAAHRLGDMTAEYAFLNRYAGTRTKFTMPAPSYHRRYWSVERSPAAGYDSAEAYLTEVRDYLRSVAHTLVGLGCDYIQLDAPNYGALCDPDTVALLREEGRRPETELEFDAALDSSVFEGLSHVTSALHICRGNGPAGTWHSRGGYEAIADRLFPALAVDRLLLEYDSDRAGGFGPLKDVRPETAVVLGLVSTKSPLLEYDADVCRRIEEAAKYKPLAELAVSTQCGFASVPVENPLIPKEQQAKLELVVSVARQVWAG